jgi:hypothetical protein
LAIADDNGRMKLQEVRRAQELVQLHKVRIIQAWNDHFKP